ncbi:type II toxin-antitoxin system HipA family toxin [Lonepinella koalarum]|uniref:type II toxin-antitoxin system HipA family toxin n=1 Tax=Lonepinella koalarum TaxID=53417 RepID=UPI0011E3D6B2|nr:type II toxin-antitoxin system HipA family toxin [Lonepinella koalarum]TYG35386.1 type II toxin-antitoxin system HipA family toxin [Lonepinella koalarum]
MENKLNIAMNGIRVGQWCKLDNGATEFQYSLNWLDSPRSRAISLSLPLSHKIYKGDAVFNFFDNLLPDNDQIRSRIQQRFQTQTKTPFDLLSAIGQDCVGAIQLYRDVPYFVRRVDASPLNDREIEVLLQNYQSLPLGMDQTDDFRISLAGAQEKTALLYHENQWKRPLYSTATSHIFKLPIGLVAQGQLDLSMSCENEWLCLEILRLFGLNVPKAEIRYFGETKVLIVERFDRRWSASKNWLVRLPQEDLCQALNIAPARKYEADGGAGILTIMSLLNSSADPLNDRKHFFKAQILFWLLCAIDGHTKNFSIFIEQGNRYRLTPFYDVMSAYPLMNPKGLCRQKIKMAMAWHGENKHYLWDKIQLRHIFHTAKLAGFAKENVEDILHEISKIIPHLTQIQHNHLPDFIAEPILLGVERSAKRICG